MKLLRRMMSPLRTLLAALLLVVGLSGPTTAQMTWSIEGTGPSYGEYNAPPRTNLDENPLERVVAPEDPGPSSQAPMVSQVARLRDTKRQWRLDADNVAPMTALAQLICISRPRLLSRAHPLQQAHHSRHLPSSTPPRHVLRLGQAATGRGH